MTSINETKNSLRETLTDLADSARTHAVDYRDALRDLLSAVIREPGSSPVEHIEAIVAAAREVVDHGEAALMNVRLAAVANDALRTCDDALKALT